MEATAHNCIQTFFASTYQASATESKEKREILYTINKEKSITVALDSHGGCLVNFHAGTLIPANFKENFQTLSSDLAKTGTINSVWLNIYQPSTAEALSVIPTSWRIDDPKQGHIIVDTQQKCTRIWQWINPNKECNIPPGGTHNIGATAAIVDDTARVILLIQDKQRNDRWSMPGGSYDTSLDYRDQTLYTAIRECQEETHVTPPNNGVLIGQFNFPFNQFAPGINQIWRFSVDHTKYEPKPMEETLRAQWISFDDVMKRQFEGLQIGEEILAVISKKSGFQMHTCSNQRMKLWI